MLSLTEAIFTFLALFKVAAMQKYLPEDRCSHAATTVLFISAIYILGIAVHRLIFSPIAGFPGPKLAAVTGWYEFYYDVVKKGKYLFEIERLHNKYGTYRNFRR